MNVDGTIMGFILLWTWIGIIIGDRCRLSWPRNFKQYVLFMLLIGPLGITSLAFVFIVGAVVVDASEVIKGIAKNIPFTIKYPSFIDTIATKFRNFYER